MAKDLKWSSYFFDPAPPSGLHEQSASSYPRPAALIPPSAFPELPQVHSENAEKLAKDSKWGSYFFDPAPPSGLHEPPDSSCAHPAATPHQIHLTKHPGKAEGGRTELPSYAEETTKTSPVMMNEFSTSSPPKSTFGSTPVNNYFLAQLTEEAFDGAKLTTMEGSIRRFHSIATDADIQLTRNLCSIAGTKNFGEKRRALIDERNRFMEAAANSVLVVMDILKDEKTAELPKPQGQTVTPPFLERSAWKKGQSCFLLVDDTSSEPAHVSLPLPTVVEIPPTPRPVSALTPSTMRARSKKDIQLALERLRCRRARLMFHR